MALVNGFDPSKEYVVVKGFFEAGKHYRQGDKYQPKTPIGKSKVLFRHFIAGRVKLKESKPVERPKTPVEDSTTPQEGVSKKATKPKKQTKKPKKEPKKEEPVVEQASEEETFKGF